MWEVVIQMGGEYETEDYMRMAIELAQSGCGYVNPNPMVGAVIVKKGKIIGRGFHEKYGQLHAERNAIADCKESPWGATMYVTLEPCCHYGKTPPCTQAIIESGIAEVVIGSHDPNPLVAGKGIEILHQNGINVRQGILKEECDKLNEVFFHYIRTHIPFVVMKYAMTMDGKIATCTGKSKWITSEKARQNVHASRLRYSAIMVGVNTVISDDPLLTCRIPGGRNPIRIICDTNLRNPLDSAIMLTAKDIPTYIATACTDQGKQQPYLLAGCKIITVIKKGSHIDLQDLMKKLGMDGIDSILLEGGSELNYSALQCGIVNRVQTYIAPKLFGGVHAKGPIGGTGIEYPDQAFYLKESKITMFDEDILIESEVINDVYRNY